MQCKKIPQIWCAGRVGYNFVLIHKKANEQIRWLKVYFLSKVVLGQLWQFPGQLEQYLPDFLSFTSFRIINTTTAISIIPTMIVERLLAIKVNIGRLLNLYSIYIYAPEYTF